MSPPSYSTLMSMAQHHHPKSFDAFNNPDYPKTDNDTGFHEKDVRSTFADIQESCHWPNAILAHQDYVGPNMMSDDQTIHRSTVVHSTNPVSPSTEFRLISTKTSKKGDDQTVVTCLAWYGPEYCIEPREPELVIGNSLRYQPGTRETIDRYKVEDWNASADKIREWLHTHDPNLFNPNCGSVIPIGQVYSAGQGTNAVLIEYQFPTHGFPSAVRWRFPKEGYVSNTGSRRSSAMSGNPAGSRS